MKRYLRKLRDLPKAAIAHASAGTVRGPRFAGVYRDAATARAALPASQRDGYDDASIANVSFDWMCRRQALDYPVVHWLSRLLPDGGTLIDAGGHLGTKYIAFQDILDLSRINWIVYDVPGMIAAARKRQAAGKVPAQITFTDEADNTPPADAMLASGVLQYSDLDLSAFVSQFSSQPAAIIVNKLPLHDRAFVTLERIGATQVPYRVRAIADWRSEVAVAGYEIADSWTIAGLDHQIATHPWLGQTESRGYLLRQQG